MYLTEGPKDFIFININKNKYIYIYIYQLSLDNEDPFTVAAMALALKKLLKSCQAASPIKSQVSAVTATGAEGFI